MSEYKQKIQEFMISDIEGKKDLTILEFGVREGTSTKLFLNHCEKNGGKVYSVDMNDYSHIANSPNWKFIKSRDDNFNYVEKFLPEKFDLIYLDSFHDANHVEKIFYYYFKKLKKNCYFYFDDICWLPYLKGKDRDSFNCEINNKETFTKLVEILNSNKNILNLYFSFVSSGMAKFLKKEETDLNKPKKINSREISLKNIIRKIIKK